MYFYMYMYNVIAYLTKGKSVCMIYKFESSIKRQKHFLIAYSYRYLNRNISRLLLPYFNNAFMVILSYKSVEFPL